MDASFTGKNGVVTICSVGRMSLGCGQYFFAIINMPSETAGLARLSYVQYVRVDSNCYYYVRSS